MQGKILRDEVATLCLHLQLLSSKAGRDATFEVKSMVPFSQPWENPKGPAAATDWEELLARAELHAGVTGKTVDGVYPGVYPARGRRGARGRARRRAHGGAK